MKKKLDELKKSLPDPDSPIPSPDINAPSPENTPPFVGMPDYSNSPPSLVNYSDSAHTPSNYGQGLQQNCKCLCVCRVEPLVMSWFLLLRKTFQ